MQAVNLVISLAITWVIFRLLAGRATLATAYFIRIFVVGAVLSFALAVVAERLTGTWASLDQITRLYAGPIDEIAKALPLLIVISSFAAWQRLTVSDYALLGLAAGLGYTFTNWSLVELAGVRPQGWHAYLFGSLRTASEWEPNHPVFFTGALTTSFIGLAAGVALRIAPRRSAVVAVTLGGVVVVAFENTMYRWLVGPLAGGWPAHLQATPSWLLGLHDAMLDGQLELWLLIGGLLVANWVEGRWTLLAARNGRDRRLIDEDATAPLVVVEWIIAAQRLRYGWSAFRRVNRYFRDRRAYLLLRAECLRAPSEDALSAATELDRRLLAERAQVEAATSSQTGAPHGWPATRIVRWIAGHPLHLVVAALFGVYLMVPPNDWLGLKATLYSDRLAAFLIVGAVVALAGGAWKLPALLRGASPAAPTHELIAPDLAILLTGGGACVTAIAIVVWFLSFNMIVPNYTYATHALEPLAMWSGYGGYPAFGGNPHTFFAVAAMLLACIGATRMSEDRLEAAVPNLKDAPAATVEAT